HHLGRHEQAVVAYRQALDLYRQQGNRYGEAETLIHLGDTYQVLGDHDAVQTAWLTALSILDKLDHPDADHVRTKLADLDQTTPENEEHHRKA
ncbi:MAG TPA: tetratricopeptide repeat protein, partial [Pilimelia sp.]|nr:tetratricopeptide repeat protein [Pilimelia sp.]